MSRVSSRPVKGLRRRAKDTIPVPLREHELTVLTDYNNMIERRYGPYGRNPRATAAVLRNVELWKFAALFKDRRLAR